MLEKIIDEVINWSKEYDILLKDSEPYYDLMWRIKAIIEPGK